MNEQGDELRGEGKLCLRGPNIFLGYRNNAEATKKSITPDRRFMTGDMGSQDEEGNLYLIDRLKHLIRSKGFQISLAKMESVLHEHPLVHDVVALGVHVQKTASEVPFAYVVLNEGTEGKQQVAEEPIGYAATEMVPHNRLRGGIIWIDGIPKGPSQACSETPGRRRGPRESSWCSVYGDRSSKP
jgi:acyl-CoA synthetase (AMP-forming)/AMP-acid ligase II